MKLESPAPYPAHLTSSWPLGLSHSVSVRPIRPEDADIELEFARNLSHETRYNRFLGGGFALTREWLDRFTRIDFTRDMALIATVTLDGKETLISVARYVRLQDNESCEFAVTVADAWQGHGIGRRLMEKLIAHARSTGLRRMTGEVLATNAPMLRLASSLGFRIETHPDGPQVRHVSLDLERHLPPQPDCA